MLRAHRVLRVLLCAVPLAWVLGGGCVAVFHDHDDDDDDDDDHVIIIVNNGVSGSMAQAADEGLDPELFRLDESTIEVADGPAGPELVRVTGIEGLSPARIWSQEQIGDRELAAFASAVLRVNEDRLALPAPASALGFLDMRLESVESATPSQATVILGRPETGAPELAVRFESSGELVAIERLDAKAGDRTAGLR